MPTKRISNAVTKTYILNSIVISVPAWREAGLATKRGKVCLLTKIKTQDGRSTIDVSNTRTQVAVNIWNDNNVCI